MAARIAAASTRLLLLALIATGATAAAMTLPPRHDAQPARHAAAPSPSPERATLVIPDIRKQAYVFAKGELEEAGLDWRVAGPVKGFAGNIVVSQLPEPGTVFTRGEAPTMTLRLARNTSYSEQGQPENSSPSRELGRLPLPRSSRSG